MIQNRGMIQKWTTDLIVGSTSGDVDVTTLKMVQKSNIWFL